MTALPLRRYGAKFLAILLPLLLLALAWSLIAVPLLDVSDGYHDQRDGLLRLIAAERREIAAGPAWENALSRLQAQESQGAGMRPETSEALAEAGLQNDIQQMIAAQGGQIVSVEPLPAVMQNDFQAISIRVAVTLPGPAVAGLLRQIETHVPYMFISSASLQTSDPGFDQTGGSSAAQISMLCTITAYRRP